MLSLLADAWPPSLILGGLGVLIGAPLGILLGMAAALRRNTWIDYLASAVATLGLTIPVFVISMLLILVFAVWLNWLPASGWGKPERWILPIIAYAAIPLATYARYTRSAMLDTLNRPFVTALARQGAERTPHHLPARAAQLGDPDGHGVPADVHRHRHRLDLRRGDVPRARASAPTSSPRIENRDYPLEMALMLMVTLMFCVAYLLSDIAYAWLNPRIRVGERRQ